MSSTPDQADSLPLELPVTEDGDVAAAGAAAALEIDRPVASDAGHDERLLEAHDLALAALREITPDATIGAPAGYTLEEGGVVSLLFENRLGGYPGWFWTVSVARVVDAEPTVLEAELLPGEGALLAPDWVPWALRLAEYQAAQAALAEAAGGDAGHDDFDQADADDLDEVDDLDAVDFDDDGSPILHSGDVDGVDIDELDLGEADDSDDDDESDEDDDDSDDDDESDASDERDSQED